MFFHLGELYHDAAIISYINNMESTVYKDGVDEPKELLVHINIIAKFTKLIQKDLTTLSACFSSFGQQLDILPAMDAANEILLLLGKVKTYKELGEYILIDNRLMESADKLSLRIQQIILQYNTHVEKIMPLDFSYYDFLKISYDDIKRHPQASVQLAFSHFESFLRSRLNASSDLFGEGLINAAFAANGGLKFGETSSEQIGTRNFISGAYAIFRNPRMHRIVADDDKSALNIIATVDMMIKIIEQSVKTSNIP